MVTKPTWTLDQITTNLTRVDAAWSTPTVTYGFFEANPNYGAEAAGFSTLTDEQRAAARLACELWDDLVAIDLEESGSGDSAAIRFGNTTTGPGQAWAYYPGDYEAAGDIWINPNSPSNFDLYAGGYGTLTLLHEIGHALGLSHPGDYDAGDGTSITYEEDALYRQDSRQHTAMSYFDAYETGADHWDDTGLFSYASTPLLHDIAAIQSVYGADTGTRWDNTVYGFNSTAGRDVFDLTQNQHPVFAIWDGGGWDTLDLSGYSLDSVIDLAPGSFSSCDEMTQNIAIAYGCTIEEAVGGFGSDQIYGNAGANSLFGGGGYDWLDGRKGNDYMEGGPGADIYRVGQAGDVVVEFADGGDDEVQSTISYTLGGNLERLTLLGTASINGTGNGSANDLIGNSGANRLDGKGGHDFMSGMAGNDIYVVNSTGDLVAEGPGNGIDTVQSTISYTLGANLDRLALQGSAAINGTGNALANAITGNAAANVLAARGGNDTLDGADGSDVLRGELGTDRLLGGTGGDRFDFNSAAECGKGAARDVIADFLRGVDKIDLVTVDADIDGTTGNQAFSWRGSAGFSGIDGELRYVASNGSCIVQGDTNGDKLADLEVQVLNVSALVSTDFYL